MKLLDKRPHSNSIINAASDPGTIFYRITEDQVEDLDGDNLFIKEAFNMYGFNAFDLSTLYGSIVEDNVLYLCKTDGQYITVEGEEVDPEEALSQYGVAACSSYIQDGTPDIIRRNLSGYELNKEYIDVDEIALSLLQAGHHFREIVEDADDAYVLDN